MPRPPAPRPQPEHVRHGLELLGSAGAMRARRMFGGWGVYADDLFIALIADDQLYLKVNALTRPQFEAAGGAPFMYSAKGKSAVLGFYTPPADALDSPALMQPWAALAVQAALAARAARAMKPTPRARAKGIARRSSL